MQQESSAVDQKILRLLKDRDPGGVCLLLSIHGPRVRGLLRRELGSALNQTEIDDALNTAAYRAWRDFGTFDGGRGTLRSWFFKIAQNAGIDLVRLKRQERADQVVNDELDGMPGHHWADGEEPVYALPRPFLDVLRACIRQLPPTQRKIIEADLAAGEIADAESLAQELGTTRNSVYASRSMARTSLRHALIRAGLAPDGGKEGSWL